MAATRHSHPPAPCHPGSQEHICLIVLKTVALGDPWASCSQIPTWNFQTGRVSLRLSDWVFQGAPLIYSTPLPNSGKVVPLLALTRVMWKTCYIYPYLGYPCLLAIVTSRSPFVLKTPRRRWYPSAPHSLLHVWDPCGGQGKRPQPISASCIWFPVHLWSDVLN